MPTGGAPVIISAENAGNSLWTTVMTIEQSEPSGIPCLALTGEVGTADDDMLLAKVDEVLAGPGAKVILDLGGVRYMNSTGINTLVRINAQANQRDQRVVFANPAPLVDGVFRTTQLDRFFTVTRTVADAVSVLQR